MPAQSNGKSSRAWLTVKQAELLLMLMIIGLFFVAMLSNQLLQDPAYHEFVDTRAWLGLPNALNTLTNGAFAVVGFLVLYWLVNNQLVFVSLAMRVAVWLFSIGAIAIAAASAYYHLWPDNATLAVDRFAMSVTFAAVLAMLVADRVSSRASWPTLAVALVLGPMSVWIYAVQHNLTPYYVVQFGGILLMLVMLLVRATPTPGPNFTALLWCYLLAKVAEALDHEVFAVTHGLISGHSLKHLFAALGMLMLIWPLKAKHLPASSINPVTPHNGISGAINNEEH